MTLHLRVARAQAVFALFLAFAASPFVLRAQESSPRGAVVLSQPGFPTIDSEPVSQRALAAALGGDTVFLTLQQLRSGAALGKASLLVLPYGSAFPAEAWPAIQKFVQGGGNLLLIGGQPLRVPVSGEAEGTFKADAAQDSYSQMLGFRHSYAVPLGVSTGGGPLHFAWREGYDFLPQVNLAPKAVFAQEGRLNGLGYLQSRDGTEVAAPVIVVNAPPVGGTLPARIVALPFTPATGFWDSGDGERLIGAAARYALAGPTQFMIETQYAALRPAELPMLTARLRQGGAAHAATQPKGTAQVELRQGQTVLDTARLPLGGESDSVAIPFRKPLPAGLYTVRATWTPDGSAEPQEFAENGFVVEDLSALETGPALGVHGDFLSLGGKPFFPVGTNYFTTEENGWDFSGPRNDAVWERDFADMERHGVSFVRTGVWMNNGKFVEPATGEVNERFLRNLEAFLAAAQRHGIAVNFTCFAFTPAVGEPRRRPDAPGATEPPPPNPFLDNGAVRAEQQYVASIVKRFQHVPWLSYDLINEPSFSNPRVVFHGNVPNGDPAELSAWHAWLEKRYSTLTALAAAWRVTPEQLAGFDHVPLPKAADLSYERNSNPQEIRAFDYNLFAQDMFSGWVKAMVSTIRQTGSEQPINVGQDEGGVSNRLLNQFYATAGVSFTTNHTYWNDDALLWDSVAAKRPGMPNITGETGYQPAWNPDGSWRYDEVTGTAIEERKWALGFAAGSSGAMQWDWAREVDFGMQRSDGSAKVWEGMMRDLGSFAKAAAPYATGLTLPEIALILPQSLQLSALNSQALEAQQTAVRALFYSDRVEAYAVGEFQTDTLGTPKLIILPSAYGLSAKAWSDIEARVRGGAVLLISGPFSGDEHLHATDRATSVGIPAGLAPLNLRDNTLRTPVGSLPLVYNGLKTTMLDRDVLPNDKNWTEVPLGRGKVLFSAFPLELNSDLKSVATVYAEAIKQTGVSRTYSTAMENPGVLICPTKFPHATLYVLTSETDETTVSFEDKRSGKRISGVLPAGRAALLLVSEHGEILTSYGWHAVH